MKFQVLLITFVTVFVFWVGARPMDKIDECLFTCDYCFKGEVLLNCANQCLVTADKMSFPWTEICPYLNFMEFNRK